MRKLFSLIAAVLFAGSMFAAVGNVFYTLEFKNTSGKSGYANAYDYTWADMNWSVPGNMTQGDFDRIGGNKLTKQPRNIVAASPMGSAIAKIVINHNGGNRKEVILDSITVTVASDADFTQDVVVEKYGQHLGTGDAKIAAGTIELLPTADSWATNSYYKITLFVTNSSSSNGGLDVATIAFYAYQDASAPAINAANIELGTCPTKTDAFSKTVELAVVGANLSAPIAVVNGIYTTATGELTAEGGTLAVTFAVEAEGEYNDALTLTSGETSIQVTVRANVVKTVGIGTQDDPFTVSDVVKLNSSTGVDNKFWVIGYIVGCAGNGGATGDVVATNLAIGETDDQTEGVLPVELPSGDIRTALNLVDNPSYLGKQVKLHGALITYFNFKGVKSVDAYEFVEEPVAGCDWDNIEFFNVGIAPEDENYNQFKICKAGENPNIVNIQVAPWADNNKGIYINFPSAEFTTISLPESQYTAQGAGILLYLSAFTAQETEVTINYQGADCVFTVYNAKAGATAISNTAAEAKAVKFFENGQLIIMMNNVKYNAQGQIVK